MDVSRLRYLQPLAICIAILACGLARACTCSQPTVQEALKHSDAVFLGTISNVQILEPDNPGSKVVVRFDVARVWKGPVTKDFEMRSITETSFCEGFYREELWKGRRLLVYAYRVREGFPFYRVTFSTNICSRTGPIEDAKEDLKQLGPGQPPS